MRTLFNQLVTTRRAHCGLCLNPTTAADAFCEPCYAALPVLRHACVRCAQPLAAPLSTIASATDGKPVPERTCGACIKQSPPLTFSFCAFHYRAPLSQLIAQFKYGESLHWLPGLANAACRVFADRFDEPPKVDAVIPVPLHPSRVRARGYNQSQLLAAHIANQFHWPLRPEILSRIRATPPQAGLKLPQRQRNVRDAFALRQPPPARVVLIDDVMTTGATLHEIARLLLSAGSGRVDAFCLARA